MSSPDAGSPESILIDGRPGAQVSVLERGLHYGDGLFETIACWGGRPRFLELHLQRLARGCARLAIQCPDPAVLAREIDSLAAISPRGIVKLILTRGVALARGYAVSGHELPTRIALRYAWPQEDAHAAGEGVRVRLAKLRLGENALLAGLKHCNRLEQVLARAEWTDPAIAEALLFSDSGALISGTMSNVFLVHGARLATPRVDRCGVAGVMREVVLRTAPRCRIGAEEKILELRDVQAAEEIFLTSALTGIRPVRELEGRTLSPGPLTRALQQALAPLLAGREHLPAAADR